MEENKHEIVIDNINEIIKKLINKCDLGENIEEIKRVSGGLLNRMYKVKTSKGIFAIKFLNPEVMKRADAKNNHIFAEKIANIAKENNVKCLPAKVIKGSTLQKIEEYYFLVFDWFDGKAICDEELTIDKCRKVAIELAKIHKIDYSKYEDECKAYYDTSSVDWSYYIDKITNNEIKELLLANIDKYKELDERAIESLEKISKNLVISHRDIDLPNVLWNKDNEPVFIDWESTGLVNPVMEVIDTAWNWAGGQKYFDIEKFKIFVQTYKEQGGKLLDYEDALNADYKAKFGWLEYNIKRVCGIECIDEEEKRLGENEVIRTIDEINKFYLYYDEMKSGGGKIK